MHVRFEHGYILTSSLRESFNNMKLTNVVVRWNFNCSVDLRVLARQLSNVQFNPKIFSGLIYHHRKAGGNCLVFANGHINTNGKCTIFKDGVLRLRHYARLLQKYVPVVLTDVGVVTASGSH